MIQLIIFILNAAGKFLGKLISNKGCLVSFIAMCVVVFFILGSGAQLHKQELQKAHPELFTNDIQDNSSPHSGQHIAGILFFGFIIVLIALSIKSKFKKNIINCIINTVLTHLKVQVPR